MARRRRRHPVRTAAAAFALLPAVLGACGRSTSASITSVGGAGSATEADLAAAQRIVLNPVDLPGYRVETGAAPDATTARAAAAFQQCAGAGATALGGDLPTARSPGFRNGTSTSISSLAVIARDEAAARATVAELGRAELGRCVTGLLRAVLESDLEHPVDSASSELLPGASAGDQTVTWRTTLQFSSDGQKLAAYSHLTFVRSGRAVATLFDFQTAAPFPSGERLRLLSTMVGRMGGI